MPDVPSPKIVDAMDHGDGDVEGVGGCLRWQEARPKECFCQPLGGRRDGHRRDADQVLKAPPGDVGITETRLLQDQLRDVQIEGA